VGYLHYRDGARSVIDPVRDAPVADPDAHQAAEAPGETPGSGRPRILGHSTQSAGYALLRLASEVAKLPLGSG